MEICIICIELILASRFYDVGNRLLQDEKSDQRSKEPKVNWWQERKDKSEEMIGVDSLTHPVTIINHVIANRIIAMIVDFLMKIYLQKCLD